MAIYARIKNDVVKESNEIARAQLSPPANSVWEERIIAYVAAFNRIQDTEFPETAFWVGQIVSLTKKISTRQLSEIHRAAKKLAGTTFTLYRSRNSFRTYAVFDYIDFDHGIITAKLNQSLKPHYLELKKQFTIRSLPGFCELTSIYSQQLFRLLNSWAKLPEAIIPITELHHVTTVPNSLKRDFRNFRVRVLNIAHREINQKTSLKFDWEPVKQGRKVIAVKFLFPGKQSEKRNT